MPADRWNNERLDDLRGDVEKLERIPAELATTNARLEDLAGQITRNREREAEEHETIHQRITRTRADTDRAIERIRTTIRNTLLGLGGPVAVTVILRIWGVA